MGDFLRVLQDMAKGFLLVPFFRMLFYGIIFRGGHVRIQPDAELSLHRQCKSFILDTGFFLSFSFLFAFMGYLSNLQLEDDILSPVRRKLVGYWEVRAQTRKIDRAGGDVAAARTGCAIPRASPHSIARPSP
jgi:hypothetical protein